MIAKTSKKKGKNSFDIFPDNRDFFFLDSYEKTKSFKSTTFDDPEYICVVAENEENKIKENLYIRKDFLADYEFIKVIEIKSNIYLNFMIPKKKINIGGSENRLLVEIKSRPCLIKEIYKRTKINFNTQDHINFQEEFSVPSNLKFYNRIFALYIQKENVKNNPNFKQNNNINFNNNLNNSNIFNPNNNQFINNNISHNNQIHNFNDYINNNNLALSSYKNKEDRKGHTGFF